jgi:hypothetical protein
MQRSLKRLKRPHHQDLVNLIEKHRSNPHLQEMIGMLKRELDKEECRWM